MNSFIYVTLPIKLIDLWVIVRSTWLLLRSSDKWSEKSPMYLDNNYLLNSSQTTTLFYSFVFRARYRKWTAFNSTLLVNLPAPHIMVHSYCSTMLTIYRHHFANIHHPSSIYFQFVSTQTLGAARSVKRSIVTLYREVRLTVSCICAFAPPPSPEGLIQFYHYVVK